MRAGIWGHGITRSQVYEGDVPCPCVSSSKARVRFCSVSVFLFSLFPSSIHKLRENVFQEHQSLKEKELETGPKASHGYGGKFGVEQDRMDKVRAQPLHAGSRREPGRHRGGSDLFGFNIFRQFGAEICQK